MASTTKRDRWFRRFAESTSVSLGKPVAFLSALALVVLWGVTGPYYHYSETWQMVINTGTTIVTFLMVFLLQNTQARDSTAIHLKLNELLRAVGAARNTLVSLEKLPDEQLQHLHDEFSRIAGEADERGINEGAQ